MIKYKHMVLKQKLLSMTAWIRSRLTKKVVVIGVIALLAVSYAGLFFPKTVQFSYNGPTCVSQLTVFPKILKTERNDGYELSIKDETKVFGYPLFAHSVCAQAIDTPKEGETRLSLAPFGWLIGKKNFIIKTARYSTVAVNALSQPLVVARPLKLDLSRSDTIFTYKVAANQKISTCNPSGNAVLCDLKKVGMNQGGEYVLSIDRYFNNKKVETIVEKSVKTLPATNIVGSSVVNEQTIYDKPTLLTFTADKSLRSSKATATVKVDDKAPTQVPLVTEVNDKVMTVRFNEPLVRSSTYSVTLDEVEAVDGSSLEAAYVNTFKVSGGPKVTGVSAGSSGVSSNASIVIQFDQALQDNQDITKYVSISGGNATIAKLGDKVIVKLSGLPKCTDFTLKAIEGLKSKYDVESTTDWQYVSRTLCHTVGTIGYSVQGRAINAYYFGNGPTTILYTGAIHGNEQSSRYVTQRWIEELEAKARDIPADRQIVVVPIVNPDGIARSGRNNVNNVNLNRNFPTFNWTSDTPVSSGTTEKGAGGPSALSEPESKALADFTILLQPRFVVTYHSKGSLVNSNDVSTSVGLGQQYARLAGYSYISNAATNETFGFTMTGTYEDWLIERGIPAILIELNTDTGYHFNQNRAAMWTMLRG